MNLLLIVGTAKDVFIYNLAKWLKKHMDINIDVVEFHNSNNSTQSYDYKYYDNVTALNRNKIIHKNKIFNILFSDHDCNRQLHKILQNKHYDIIQIHYFFRFLVKFNDIEKYCDKSYVMFWGGELETYKILNSNKLFKKRVKSFLKNVTGITNSISFKEKFTQLYPTLKNKYIPQNLGSSPLEELYNMISITSKEKSKEYWNIPINKKVLMIGYSGKKIHNHLDIIKKLKAFPDYIDKIHLLAPMTRGAESSYINEVEQMLKDSGYTFTLLKDIFLSDKDVSHLRNATDIVFQYSDFDGYSRSLIECLCAKAILIYGEWLNYENKLSNDDFIAFKTANITEGCSFIKTILKDYQEYTEITEQNSDKGKKYIWSECIKGWVNLYNQK